LKFYISALGINENMSSAVSHIQFSINNYQTLELNVALKSGDRVLCDGSRIFLCDKFWKKLKVIYEGRIMGELAGEFESQMLIEKIGLMMTGTPFEKIDLGVS